MVSKNGKRRHVTDLNGEHALAFLRHRPKDKKFALTVAFYATHAMDNAYPPYQPMNESFALYVNDTIIDELKEQGVYNNTLLVFTTDNGVSHGEHGLAEKGYPFEESIKVPLVIQDPRMPDSAKGTRNGDFTLSVDIAPTLLSAANIPVPKFMQGRDIAQLYLDTENAARTWRQDFFYEWAQGDPITAEGSMPYFQVPAVFALIGKDYKYFYWPQTRYEQLFRIESDPYEENDILNSTAQTTQQALHMMRARYVFLKKWAQSGNPV